MSHPHFNYSHDSLSGETLVDDGKNNFSDDSLSDDTLLDDSEDDPAIPMLWDIERQRRTDARERASERRLGAHSLRYTNGSFRDDVEDGNVQYDDGEEDWEDSAEDEDMEEQEEDYGWMDGRYQRRMGRNTFANGRVVRNLDGHWLPIHENSDGSLMEDTQRALRWVQYRLRENEIGQRHRRARGGESQGGRFARRIPSEEEQRRTREGTQGFTSPLREGPFRRVASNVRQRRLPPPTSSIALSPIRFRRASPRQRRHGTGTSWQQASQRERHVTFAPGTRSGPGVRG